MSHAIRRVVTGHDDNGKAVVESDGIAPNVKIREGAGFVSTLLWVTDETPANVGLRIDRADRTIAVVIPELVRPRWWEYLLHNSSAAGLKAARSHALQTARADAKYSSTALEAAHALKSGAGPPGFRSFLLAEAP